MRQMIINLTLLLTVLVSVALCAQEQSANKTSLDNDFVNDNDIDKVLTFKQFSGAVGTNFRVDFHYEAFVRAITNKTHGIRKKVEAAMFLAQVLHESMGLSTKQELDCTPKEGCPAMDAGKYGRVKNNVTGHYYYGRGYIQLTHAYNYNETSQWLYGDDRLFRNPELVATDEDTAWQTAFVYWKRYVHRKEDVSVKHQFGSSTRVINSRECTVRENHKIAKKRFAIYKRVFARFFPGSSKKPIEKGCYPEDNGGVRLE